MVIAVDIRLLADDENDNFASFVYHSLLQLAAKMPVHTFLFFTDKIKKNTTPLPANVGSIIISPKVSNRLNLSWWYEVKLPSAIKKHKASMLICASNTCSFRTKVPQLLLLDDYHTLNKKRLSEMFMSKKRLSSSLHVATTIGTLTQYTKQEYSKAYKLNAEKMEVVGIATKEINTPLIWEEREKVKGKYTDGCEYFVCHNIDESQIIPLLKAFSIFKKWQKSNMKLVFSNVSIEGTTIEEKIANYKHKNELFFYDHLSKPEITSLLACAYASIHLSENQLFALLQSLQLEVPILTLKNGNIQEITYDAALYFDSIIPEQIAESMKVIYKDEQLRSQIIQKGKERVGLFSTKMVLTNLQNAIEKTLNSSEIGSGV